VVQVDCCKKWAVGHLWFVGLLDVGIQNTFSGGVSVFCGPLGLLLAAPKGLVFGLAPPGTYRYGRKALEMCRFNGLAQANQPAALRKGILR
jgi:hypothetical protein